MRRFMVLVTVVVLMTAMLVVSAAPALSRTVICPSCEGTCPCSGTAIPRKVCEVVADDSPNIGWRNETCWVFHPVSVSNI
jgi:hypothetical protein